MGEREGIIDIVRSLSGEGTIPYLLDELSKRGFEKDNSIEIMLQLVTDHKIIVDNEGNICWTYNPGLTAHYRNHPELRIR